MVVLLSAACQREQPAVQLHPVDAVPQRLSDWGVLIQSGDVLRLNQGVTAYDLNTPLFTDYAQKLRTVWLPPGQSATYHATDRFDFPVGTIISKTFYYPLTEDRRQVLKQAPTMPGFDGRQLHLAQVRLLETRLLIHQESGWQALPYVWNQEQTEAYLSLGGDWIDLSMRVAATQSSTTDTVNHFSYIVPDANQCAGCHATDHSSGEPRPIGPKARHLNRLFTYQDGRANQLAYWQQHGLLKGLPTQRPQAAAWVGERDAPLEQRARAYLDINCGHCHNPSGPADTSGLFLDAATVQPRQLGVCKPPVAAGRGSGGHRYAIQPGHPQQSILAFRMTTTDPGMMMPELGRSLVHDEGVALIEQWIQSMPGSCADSDTT